MFARKVLSNGKNSSLSRGHSNSPNQSNRVQHHSNAFVGGPQTVNGIGALTRGSSAADTEQPDRHSQQKLQKRIQLRHLLVNKFRNKYITLNGIKDAKLSKRIIEKIDNEMTHIFGLKHFQEKDLLMADLTIREFVKTNLPTIETYQKSTKSESVKNRSQMNVNSKTIDFSKNLGMPRFKQNDDNYEQVSGLQSNSRLGSLRKHRQKSMDINSIKSTVKARNGDYQNVMGNSVDLNSRQASQNVKQRASLQLVNLTKSNDGRDNLNFFDYQGPVSLQKHAVYKRQQTAANFRSPNSVNDPTKAELDPLSKIRIMRDDPWSKITQYNQKIYQLSIKEAADNKKLKQDQMREALNIQLQAKKQFMTTQANKDNSWVKEHMTKIQKEIQDDENKQKKLRKNLLDINNYSLKVAQEKTDKEMKAKKGWLDFEHTSKLKNEEIIIKDKELQRKRFLQKQYDAKQNIERFYKDQKSMRQQRDLERLKFGGYGHVANEVFKEASDAGSPQQGSPSMRTNLMKAGVVEPKYDDIFNNVFYKPTPPAHVLLAEKADLRLKMIKQKFNFNQQNSYSNEKVERDFIENQAKVNTELDRRFNTRKSLAIQAREFQKVQMKEQEKQRVNDQRKAQEQAVAARRDIEVYQEELKQLSNKKKDQMSRTQNDLFKQIAQRREILIENEIMHPNDAEMNKEILINMDNNTISPRLKNRPF